MGTPESIIGDKTIQNLQMIPWRKVHNKTLQLNVSEHDTSPQTHITNRLSSLEIKRKLLSLYKGIVDKTNEGTKQNKNH